MYYSTTYQGTDFLENDSSSASLSTDVTSAAGTSWELFHIIALHYDLAGFPIPALLHYYDSSAQLASLGVRDKSHGRLLSSYLVGAGVDFELQRIH